MTTDPVEVVAMALAENPPPGDYDEVPAGEVFTRPRYSFLAERYTRQARAVIATYLSTLDHRALAARIDAWRFRIRTTRDDATGEWVVAIDGADVRRFATAQEAAGWAGAEGVRRGMVGETNHG